MKNSGLAINRCLPSIVVLAAFLLITVSSFGQETSDNVPNEAGTAPNLTKETFNITTPAKTQLALSSLSKQPANGSTTSSPQSSGVEGWHFEIRPYIWLAGLDGRARVGNQTVEIGKDAKSVLGMLDFAAAAQIEAIKGNWRLIFDENYVNLGTTADGPRGNVSIDVQPNLNVFEFGASYTALSIPNKKATATDPLPPVFTAEVHGGGRFVRVNLKLEPANASAVSGSRNLLGAFIGNRFKVSPRPGLTLIGEYSVGGSGAGSNFAWSADTMVDFRWKKGFSIAGGYRWLGLNADQPSHTIGFDGTERGLVLTLTLYR